MKQEQKKALLFELANTLLQSWWTLVAGVCLGLSAAIVMLAFTDKIYMSTARIYVTPEISKELGRPIIADDMTRRMAAMEDAVLTEEHLERLAEQLYGPAPTPEKLQSRMARVRRNVEVLPVLLGVEAGTDMRAFDLAFYDVEPERAARAANLLAQAYIAQNSEFRQSQAEQAAAAAAEQAQAAKQEFDAANLALTRFTERHGSVTGPQSDANLRMLERRQGELEKTEETRRQLDGKLVTLEKRLSELRTGGAAVAGEVLKLRRELDDLLTQYSEEHPRVIQQRRRLADALAAYEGQEPAAGESGSYPADPEIAAVQEQIEGVKGEIAQLEARQRTIRTELAEYEQRLAAVPQIAPELGRLESEAAMLRERYQKLQATADQTKQALFLEQALRGARFELAAEAQVPMIPVYPEPLRFYALGVFAGCLLFVGPLVAWRFLNPVVASEAGLRALSDVPVLVAIPRIDTPATRGYRTRRVLKNLALSTVSSGVFVATFLLMR